MFPNHLYYNKKFDNSKYLKILKYYHLEFFNIFASKLPKFFDAVDRKNAVKNIIAKEEGILKNFVFYNSQVISFLIIDIDNKDNFKNKLEIFDFLNDYNIPPSYILESKKGYHVGFILTNAIPYENKKAVNFARDVLNKLIFLLGGDKNAARLKGRWRNPLKHNTFYTLNTYDLIDLNEACYEIIPKIEIKHNENKKFHLEAWKIKNKILKVLNDLNFIKNIEVGERNSFLWYLGMMIAKNYQHLPNKLKNFSLIEEKIYFYNSNLKKPLEISEVNHIINNIKKYYLKGKIMVGLGAYEKWTNEMKNLYIKRYQKEKGIIKEHREEKKVKNKNLVLQAVYKLKSDNEKITIRNIKKICGLGNATISKYVKELKEDPKFAVLFEK